MKLLKQFIQQETVLTAAAVLAVVSAFFVPPDVQYLGYIDLRTLAILFSLMTVMAGLRRQGFFDGLGRALLSHTHSTFQLTLVLVGLCFFGSMFITNDVSLLTFVPFTFVVLSRLGADVRRSLLIPVVCMQTIAANLGSMLTPIGNPQNLYLYGKSGMSIGGFVLLMLPYTLVSLLLLLAWAAMVCRKASAALSVDELVSSASQGDQKIILLYLVLFAVCLLSVIRVLPLWHCLCRCARLRPFCRPTHLAGGGLFPAFDLCGFFHLHWQSGAHSGLFRLAAGVFGRSGSAGGGSCFTGHQ